MTFCDTPDDPFYGIMWLILQTHGYLVDVSIKQQNTLKMFTSNRQLQHALMSVMTFSILHEWLQFERHLLHSYWFKFYKWTNRSSLPPPHLPFLLVIGCHCPPSAASSYSVILSTSPACAEWVSQLIFLFAAARVGLTFDPTHNVKRCVHEKP